VTAARFSPSGTKLLTTCNDDLLRVYAAGAWLGSTTAAKRADESEATVKHNNKTGQYLTPFQAEWVRGSDDVFACGSLAQPRGVDVFHADGTAANTPPAQEFELSVLQDALRMFRKRVKLSQLDADSKLGVGPMSGTGQHRIQAMLPPRDYPWGVWEALVKAGKLRRDADGFYSIVEQPGGAHW
jgi:hypothetical protein